jgi:hypothetical protein
MSKYCKLFDTSAVACLLLLSFFFALRFWLGADPGNPFVWKAFLSVPTLFREPANIVYYATGFPALTCAAIFFGLTFIGSLLVLSDRHHRLQFIFFHAVFLLFATGIGKDYTINATMPLRAEGTVSHILLYFTKMELVQVLLLAFLVASCLNCHFKILRLSRR